MNKDHQHHKGQLQKSWISSSDYQDAEDKQQTQYQLIPRSKMEDAPSFLKIPNSECPDIWIRLPKHKWPESWSSMEDPVVPLERNLYGHPLAGLLWERQFEKILLKYGWEKVPNWECLFVHRQTLNIGLMNCRRVKWQEAEATRKDFNIVLIHQDKKIFISELFEYIYHIGCAIKLHSITNSRLIPGGQNLSERQTVFFTFVDPMNKEHKDPDVIDLDAPRLAWYHQKKRKNLQNTVYWALNRKDLSSIKHDRTQSSLRHTPTLLYPEGYHDEIWRSHIREGICVTSASTNDFLQRQLDERIGFRSCWRW